MIDALGTPAYVERVHLNVAEVIGKGRARSTKSGHHYTPEKTRKAEAEIAWLYKAQRKRDMSATVCGVGISIEVTRELARSNPKSRIGELDTSKPDVDNVCKLVCDALNGIAYADDSQVIEICARKARRTAHGTGNSIGIELRYYKA